MPAPRNPSRLYRHFPVTRRLPHQLFHGPGQYIRISILHKHPMLPIP